MEPAIQVTSTLWLPFRAGRLVRRLLASVPPADLVDLGQIVLTDRVASPRGEPAGGLYWPKRHQRAARIEIGLRTVYDGVPRLVLCLPFIPRVMLARVLFHELAHHHQRLGHGMPKRAKEKQAEAYSDKLVSRSFRMWLAVLRPLRPLVRLVNRGAARRTARGRVRRGVPVDGREDEPVAESE